MSSGFLSQYLTRGQKRVLKTAYHKLQRRVVQLVASYTPDQLEAKFRSLGILQNDAVLMHSAFRPFNGFQGTAGQVIDCLLKVIGPQGHLFMMSMAYTSSSQDYLETGRTFDVKETVSQMGFISEIFRRRKGVLRSANPLHPVLAWGPQASRIIEGHDRVLYSCGAGSPFEKMLELNTKVLFFDVPFECFTFAHYLEDRFKDSAPFPVYNPDLLECVMIDPDGQERRVKAYVFGRETIRRRNVPVLKEALLKGGVLRRDRIGNTKLLVVRTNDAVISWAQAVHQGKHFYKA